MKNKSKTTFPLTLLATSITLSFALSATAQTAEEKRSIEVIEVNATRQTENLQDVPIAVTALSAEELTRQQVLDLGDLESLVPNLNIHSGDASNAVIYIRGVGQIDSISFNDPGVGVYLDDVYLGRVQGSFLDVLDPSQIEVLRGPQGTLYGRNTIGGAVRFSSQKPTHDTSGYVKAGIGNYNSRLLKAAINGSLIEDMLAGRFTAALNKRDGYATNADGSDDYDADSKAWRGTLLFTPADQFSATLTVDGSRSSPDASRTPNRETPIYSITQGDFIPAANDPFEVDVTYNDLEMLDTDGVALTLEYVMGAHTFKSISSYREMEYRTHLDLDATADETFGIYNFEDQSQRSQELQWLYRDDRFSVVSGLYYFDEDDWSFGGAVAPDFFVPLAPGVYFPWPVLNAGERVQDNTSKAIYANVTTAITDRLNLTVGARYTKESKDVTTRGEEFFGTGITTAEEMENAFRTGVGYAPSGYSASKDWSAFTPKVGLDYQLSDDTMLYASASKGFKSGGFNGRLTSFAQPFDPETLWSYEVGSKSLLNSDQIRLNLAAFYNDYKDYQLSRFSIDPETGAFLSLFENAGSATIYGAEAEFQALLTDNLTLSANAGWLGGGYDQLTGDFEQEVSDERELVNAPDFNAQVALDYWMDLGSSGSVDFNVAVSYRTKTYLTVSSSEILAQPDYSLVNASARYVSATESWEASVYINNAFDEVYRQHGFDLSASPGVQLGYYGAPRTFGVTFTYRY